MESDAVKQLLESVAQGITTPAEAELQLKKEPFTDLGFAKIDHHRSLRQGAAEVVYGEGKTSEQLHAICRELTGDASCVLITRLDAKKAADLQSVFDLDYRKDCQIGIIGKIPEATGNGVIAVAAAGTSDLAVAEEAALTAEVLGNRVLRLYDVGVAGLHRLLAHLDELMTAQVVVAVAGMEGALPSVIAGLVSCPVIAVPTSVGYGASFGGLSALLAMLNSCASGVSVVNIDNGFGAGFQAHQINHLSLGGSAADASDSVDATAGKDNAASQKESSEFVASDPTIAFAAVPAPRTIVLNLSKSATRQSLLDQLEALLDDETRNRRAMILREARVPAKHHNDIAEINDTIDAMVAPERLKDHLRDVYAVLAAAEAQVHGVSVDETHFHEVGNGLSLLNALTIAASFFVLEPSCVLATPVQTGRGTIECSHGTMDVPAPATAAILDTGVPVVPEEELLEGELCTPTSAAIIKHFVQKFITLEEADALEPTEDLGALVSDQLEEEDDADRTSKFPAVDCDSLQGSDQASQAIKDPAGFAASKTAPFPAAGAAADATVALVPEDMLRLRDMLKAMNEHAAASADEATAKETSPKKKADE